MNDGIGKKAELKIREWLNRPEDGYCFDRLPDQLSGFYGSKNICDFTLFKSPNFYYIESKATYDDRFEFNRISEYQYNHLLEKSKIKNVFGLIIVLFVTYKRAFVLHIEDIDAYQKEYNKKSLNITKIDKWQIRYKEIKTIDNNRKLFLDYVGEIEDYV